MLTSLLLPALAALAHHPHDIVNSVALSPGFPEDSTVFCASAGTMNLFLVSRDAGFSWVNARGGMLGWQVSDLAVAPDWAESQTAFAALGEDGLQRTRDGGVSWDPPLTDKHVDLVVCGPVSDAGRSLFYAGVNKLWRSDDDGESARQIFMGGKAVMDLALSPEFERDATLAVTTRDYLLNLSSDGGETWRETQLDGLGSSLAFSPDFASDRTLWVATLLGGLQVSRDAGETFEHVAGLAADKLNDVVLSPDWPATPHVFVSTIEDGIFRSLDGGATWEACGLQIALSDQNWNHYLELAISPAYPRDPTLYCAAFEGLYTSRDGGLNWYESIIDSTSVGRHVEYSPAFERDRSAVALCYGNPCLFTSDGGDTWDMRSRGVEAMSTYSIGISPDFDQDGLLFLGVERGLRRSRDRGRTWERIALEPPGERQAGWAYEVREIVFSPGFTSDREVLAMSEAGLFRSRDAGDTWTRSDVPEERSLRLAISPQWPEDPTLFAGGSALRRSGDGGVTWSEPLVEGTIKCVSFAPDFASSGSVFAISRDEGFFRSDDRGLTWQGAPGALEGFSPSKLRLSPGFAEDGTLWVSTLSGGMRVSHDRGVSFEPLLPLGSPVDTCFDFDLSPGFVQDRTALACTFEGLLRTTDAGASWTLVTDTSLWDELRDPWILRGSGWQPLSMEGAFVFGQHRSQEQGDAAVLPFAGTGVALYGSRGPDHGLARVLIDGQPVGQIDAWASAPEPNALLWTSAELAPAFHDLSVEVLGEGRAGSSGSWIGIDAAIVDCVTSGAGELPVLARLEHMWLGPDASFGRDVRPLGVPQLPSQNSTWPRVALVALALAAVLGLWMRRRRAVA